MQPVTVIVLLWVAWGVSWYAAALWAAPAAKRLGMGSEAGYRALMILGALALAVPAHGYRGPLRFWRVGFAGAWVCIALIAAGIAFAWWARLHLGRLWSGQITRKADHHVVQSGPYGLVRHPIYTGLLLAIAATAAAKGTLFGIAGTVLVTAGIWMKARLEERWLAQELEPGAYAAYRRRVPMLVPFAPAASR